MNRRPPRRLRAQKNRAAHTSPCLSARMRLKSQCREPPPVRTALVRLQRSAAAPWRCCCEKARVTPTETRRRLPVLAATKATDHADQTWSNKRRLPEGRDRTRCCRPPRKAKYLLLFSRQSPGKRFYRLRDGSWRCQCR